jgi:hypothetical protein
MVDRLMKGHGVWGRGSPGFLLAGGCVIHGRLAIGFEIQ